MTDWRYDSGAWRWRSPTGSYYRVEYKGAKWHATLNRPISFPVLVAKFDTADAAKTACIEHWRERHTQKVESS